MNSETAFTRLVGCRLPLQQAGMAGVGGPELAVAVADAGALGMLGTPLGTSTAFAAMLMDTVRRTSGVLGVNFLVPFLDRDAVSTASSTVRLVEFFYGEPDGSLVSLVHDAGALAAWQIGSPGEAKAAVDVGCDLVVAQGVEAGGHVRSQVGLLPLLDAVIDAVGVPVVAAGGIGSARGVAAVLAAGADAARIGTRFLATVEANIHPQYQQALIEAGVEATVLTTTFSVGWPGAPHRVLRSCVEAVAASTDENVGEVRTPDGSSSAIPLRSPLPPTRETTGSIAVMAHYAGQSVGGIDQILRAADVVQELAAGTAGGLRFRQDRRYIHTGEDRRPSPAHEPETEHPAALAGQVSSPLQPHAALLGQHGYPVQGLLGPVGHLQDRAVDELDRRGQRDRRLPPDPANDREPVEETGDTETDLASGGAALATAPTRAGELLGPEGEGPTMTTQPTNSHSCLHLPSVHPQASTAASGPLVVSELRRNSVHLS